MKFIDNIMQKLGYYSHADGLQNLTNRAMNSRQTVATEQIVYYPFNPIVLRYIFQDGLMNKIIRIKTNNALNNGFNFDNDDQEEFYVKHLESKVREACQYQLGFGRGVLVLGTRNDDLTTPLLSVLSIDNTEINVFDGTNVAVSQYGQDMTRPMFWQPQVYNIYDKVVHHSRVIDFTYIQPAFEDRIRYNFRGRSESELVYQQLLNNWIMQRAIGTLINKSSSFFYKLTDFAKNLMNNKEGAINEYIKRCENLRSIYGAGVIDRADDVVSLTTSIPALKDLDDISLSGISMITDIPIHILKGDSQNGLNSTNDKERQAFNESIRNYRDQYIVKNVNKLLNMFGLNQVTGKDSSDLSLSEKVLYDKTVLENAVLMQQLGENYNTYLLDNDIIKKDDLEGMFPEEIDEEIGALI